jgi:hypothetical protein
MSGNQGWNAGGPPNSEPSDPNQPAPPAPYGEQPAPPPYGAPPPPTYGAPPPPMQPSYPPEPPPKPRGRLRSLAPQIVLLVIATALGAGFFFFRDRVSNDVTSLAPGECFDEPTLEAEIQEVQRQPCNEPHDAEVIADLTHPAPPGEAYPVVSGFDDYIAQNCVPAFQAYLGSESDTALDYDIGYFRPTLSGWADGDRGFTCYVSRSDGQKMTSTVRAGAAPTQ